MTAKKETPAAEGLAKLREPFAPHHISKLPKPTKAQTEKVKADFKSGIRCKLCGAWHHPDVVHLDYVGHAALTDRLLDTDINWSWEPCAFNEQGLPAFDQSGGLWIRLTVCGVTRLGYGHAASKPNADPGSREKEVIGDALRNAGMRFGAALDLWHKGDLHADEAEAKSDDTQTRETERSPEPTVTMSDDIQRDTIVALAKAADISTLSILDTVNAKATTRVKNLTDLTEAQAASIIKKLNKTIETRSAKPADDILDDSVPY